MPVLMNNIPILKSQNPKWPVKLIMMFVFMMILGFTPWEPLLSIQIRDNTLNWLDSITMGLCGSIGLICTVSIGISNYKRLAITLLPCLLILISLSVILSLVLPTRQWQDDKVYCNGNDYLVVQEFVGGFVTSNLKNPRVVRTTSPFGLIRKVEEQFELNDSDNSYEGDEILYKGKTWHKLPYVKIE